MTTAILLMLIGTVHAAADSAEPERPPAPEHPTIGEPSEGDLSIALNVAVGQPLPPGLIRQDGRGAVNAVVLPPILYRYLANTEGYADRYERWASIEIAYERSRANGWEVVAGEMVPPWYQRPVFVATGTAAIVAGLIFGAAWGWGQVQDVP